MCNWRLGEMRRLIRFGRLILAVLCWAGFDHAAIAQTSGLLEGDSWHRADIARGAYNVDGTGVKVCVMSDSLDNASGSLAAARRRTPPAVPAFIDFPRGQEGTGTGEGLAMLEIVHKLAPGAALGFAAGDVTPTQQKINIEALVSKGCKIIVDDISNPLDPPFQDGEIVKAMNAATDVLFISTAGNFGNRKYGASGVWEGDFHDGGTSSLFPGSKVHGFPVTQADGSQAVTLAAKLTAPTQQIWLYWSDPWDQASNLYLLRVYDPRTGWIALNHETRLQNSPAVFLDARNVDARLNCASGPPDPKNYCFQAGDFVAITQEKVFVPGNPTQQFSAPRFLRLDTRGGKIDVGTEGTAAGRNAAKNVISVGAVRPPVTGGFTGASLAEPGSADGRRRIFYDPNNNPITPGNYLAATNGGEVLDKPDLAAANRVHTTLPANTPSGPKLNPFEGTSAAAPHVAAIAALIWSYRPNLTVAQVRDILTASALDIEGAGWDNVSGYGIPMADKALALAGGMQFGPKLALVKNGNAIETMTLNPDRSILNGPAGIKANAIANGIAISTDGRAIEISKGQARSLNYLGTDNVGASSELGMVFKSDGTAKVYDVIAYNAMFQAAFPTGQIKDVIGGTVAWGSAAYYFLKRDGKVEEWMWAGRKADRTIADPRLYKVLPYDNVVAVKSMLGSLPLAMLRRDGTVVTVDASGAAKDQISYGSSVIVARPANVSNVIAIATGYAHVVALQKNGKVLAWGANSEHECDVPAGLIDVVSIAAVAHRSFALTRAGRVVSWGSSR